MPASRQLIWCGPVFEPTGYADEGREMLMAMERAGMPVALRPVQKTAAGFAEQLPAAQRLTFARQAARMPAPGCVLAQHYPADGFVTTSASGYNVGRTMFETDGLPPQWVTRCNAMDELWVPSQFNIDSFRRAGVSVPLYRVPGGIDSSVYRPDVPPLAIPGVKGTVFLAVLEWRTRKGWDLLLRAWADAFSPDDDVSLVLRASTTRTTGYGDSVEGRLHTVEQSIDAFLRTSCDGRTLQDVARIVVLGSAIASSDMPSLYTAAHAYVSPTRGEGWGRPLMEAMASGLPTIATRWSAHLEYMHDANSLLLDMDGLVPSVDPDLPVYSGQRWAQPSVSHLVTLLQRVHTDRAEARAIGVRARADMVNEWPWSIASTAIAARMREIVPPVSARPAMSQRAGEPSLLVEADVYGERGSAPGIERLLGALADVTTSVAVRSRAAQTVRPAASSPLLSGWYRLVPAETHTTRASVTITMIDSMNMPMTVRPLHGRWIIATGDVITDRMPGALACALRDRCDDVWVPHEHARRALVQAGVSEDRVWVMPFGSLAGECTPDGARFTAPVRGPVTGDMDDSSTLVFLLIVLHEHDIASAEVIVRVWHRAVPDARSRLRVVLPAHQTADTSRSWCVSWPVALASRLGAGESRVSFASLPADGREHAALVRSGDVMIDAGTGPSSMPLWHLAIAAGRPVIAMQSEDGAHWLSDAGGCLIGAGASRAMNGTELSAALRALCDQRVRAERAAAARAKAQAMPAWHDAARTVLARVAHVHARQTRMHEMQDHVACAEAFHIEGARETVIVLHADWHAPSADESLRDFAANHDMHAPVTLALCLDPAQGVAMDEVQRRVHAALAAVGKTPDTAPDIVLIPDVLTDAVLASLHRRATTTVASAGRLIGEAAA